MNPLQTESDRPFGKIFHPSDFTKGDQAAFVHALKLALAAKGKLTILHAGMNSEDVHWSDFPHVRPILARWGLLPANSSKEQVAEMGVQVEKTKKAGPDPLASILEHISDHQPDLVVLSTHQRHGVDRWTHRAMAEPIARQAHTLTLFVPRRVMGFVGEQTGTVHLDTILIPVDKEPWPQLAVDSAVGLAETLGCDTVHFIVLYVGRPEDMPELQLPARSGWTFELVTAQGDVVERILGLSEESNADLIAMTTQGHKGFLDALRGSTTERVLRGARCPVLAVPVE